MAQKRRRDVSNKETCGHNKGDNTMKKFLIATAALLLTAAAANAGCGTNTLNGTWRGQGVDSASSQDFPVLNGSFAGVALISQSKKSCRITLTVGATVYHGRTDNVSGTDRKPMMMMFSQDTPGSDLLVLYRL
jgi:predicted small secreted protein